MKRVAEKEKVMRGMARFLSELNEESPETQSVFIGDYDTLTSMVQEEYDTGQRGSEYSRIKDLYDCIGPTAMGIEEKP